MFTIEVTGLKKAQSMLKILERLGNSIKGVKLNAKQRRDNTNVTNAQIADWLDEGGRDFFSGDDIIGELDKIIASEIREGIFRSYLLGSGKAKSKAREIVAKAFIAAMERYKEIVTDRIEAQIGANNTSIKPIDPESSYGKYKDKTYGHLDVGIATGQLLDNFAPGKRNIKLFR